MKLSKSHRSQINDLITKLREAQEALAPAIVAYNAALAEAHGKLLDALEPYSEALSYVEEDVQSIGATLREEWDEKSEKWQESDKGIEASDGIEAMENFSMDDLTVEEPDMIEKPEDYAETLEELISGD
jgi:hypothetical protein